MESSLLKHQLTPLIALLSCTLLVFILYLAGLNGPLILDDLPHLLPLTEVDDLSSNLTHYLASNTGPLKRPVSMMSFIGNAMMNGDDFYAWKLVNLLIHCLSGVVVFLLGSALLAYRHKQTPTCRWLAFIIAAAWLLHPLHVSTVLYTVQRMTLLASLFSFTGQYLYVEARRMQSLGTGNGKLGLLCCFIVCLPLAVLSKETGALMIVHLFLIEILLFRFSGPESTTKSLKAAFGLLLFLPAIITVVYCVINARHLFIELYAGREFSLGGRLLSQPEILYDYIRMILLPAQMNMGFAHDDRIYQIAQTSDWHTWLYLIALSATILIAVGIRRRLPLFTLGVLYFFAGHLLESTIFPLELMYEHRNYLPSLGIILSVSVLLEHLPSRGKLRVLLPSLVIVLFAVLLGLRVQTWSSSETLFPYMLRAHPKSEYALSSVADLLVKNRRPDEAIEILSESDSFGAKLHAGFLACKLGRELDTAKLTRLSLQLPALVNAYTATAMMEIGRSGLSGQCRVPAEDYLNLMNALLALPHSQAYNHYKLMFYKAHYEWSVGYRRQAIDTLDTAHRLFPADPVPLFLSAEWYWSLGEPEQARTSFRIAAKLNRQSGQDHDSMEDSVRQLLHCEWISEDARRDASSIRCHDGNE